MSVKLFLMSSYVLYFGREFRELTLFLFYGTEFHVVFSSRKWFRTEFQVFAFCSTKWNSELFSHLWNGSERNSESFLFHRTAGIPPEQINCSFYYIFCGIIFCRKLLTLVTQSTCCCVQAIFLGLENKNTLFLVMVNSALFNDAFKALNLF